jgi:acyl dehydratase
VDGEPDPVRAPEERRSEDIEIGEREALGSHTFGADDIRRFASAFDPQPFHVDETAAANSHFGGLVASGWHTAAIWMRLMIRHRERLSQEAAASGARLPRLGPSPGFDALKWLKPVKAGETIAFSSQVIAKKELSRHREWGLVTNLNEGRNASGEVVFSFTGHVLVERRAAAPATEDAETSQASA